MCTIRIWILNQLPPVDAVVARVEDDLFRRVGAEDLELVRRVHAEAVDEGLVDPVTDLLAQPFGEGTVEVDLHKRQEGFLSSAGRSIGCPDATAGRSRKQEAENFRKNCET
jgi:hypothetical protein